MVRLERHWLVSIAALAVAANSATAHADEAYVCDDGRVVYVKLADLEMKKRTDKCVAAYWGLTTESSNSRPDTATTASIPEVPGAHTPAHQTPVANESTPLLKPTAEPEIEAPRRRNVEEKSAAVVTPTPAPNTDYRSVKIINGSNSGLWFRHTR